MKNKLGIVSIVLVLVLILSFGLSACNHEQDGKEQDGTHFHAWSQKWTQNTEFHWHAATCDCGGTAGLLSYSRHTFGNDFICTVCGYEKTDKHVHSWSDKWSTNDYYHWHASTCLDTSEVKDKAPHTFMGFVCTECGYSSIPQGDFNDVGEKFNTVVKPLYDVADTILQDLQQSGDVGLNEARNARIIGIRYFYGTSFEIVIREDIFTTPSGEKSEVLQQETGISLRNFSEHYGEAYLAYRDFLRAERSSQSLENYEEVVLPYAQKAAELILEHYNIYKVSDDKEIQTHNYGKKLVLSADSALSDIYNKIVANLNVALEKRGYPLITTQELTVTFGGNLNLENVYNNIHIDTSVSCLRYNFRFEFNQNGEFSVDYLCHIQGIPQPGYTPTNPDLLNPQTEEIAEFFDLVKIDERDLTDIAYVFDSSHDSVLFRPDGEETFIYF